MISEKELTPNKVILSIADCLEIRNLTGKSPKENKMLILDQLGLSKSSIPEIRFKQSPPVFEDIYELLTKSLEQDKYTVVRLTFPGMEKSSGGLFVSQLFSPNDLVLTETGDDIVLSNVQSGVKAKLGNALKAELFIRPLSKTFEVSGLIYDPNTTNCSLGGCFMIQFVNFIKDENGRPLVSLNIEATLNDTSKRLIGDGKTPQIHQVLNLPLDKNGIVFPVNNLGSDQKQITASEIATTIVSQILGINSKNVSKIFAAMTEIYPRPGGNLVSGIYSTQPNGNLLGYLTDFDSFDMQLTIVAEKEKVRNGKKANKPELKIWEYYANREFYQQFRNSPLAGLIHSPSQINFGYNQIRDGD